MADVNSSHSHCFHCGTPKLASLTAGLCPRCLLGVAMEQAFEDEREALAELCETVDSESASELGTGSLLDHLAGTNEKTEQPRLFGGYRLVEEIARGGMGVVYRARHQKLGREVAMKVILSGQFASANDVRRFEMEAESAASLDHPGIVPIYEIGECQGHHFFTMKLIEGGTLAKKMSDLRKDLPGFVAIIAQVAEAIDYAHRRGILHRDIKPANILLDTEGHPLVTDLGLAKRAETNADITGTGAIVGTPSYMPPEQASASKEITTSVDIFAIGAILYEGLTGRPPHIGDSPIATLMLAAKGLIRPPSDINRKCDRVLELICMKCLSRDPKERYVSSSILANDLRCWLAGEAVSVRPKSFVSVLGDLLVNQLRSTMGAVLIGIVGGFITGLPFYSSLALRLFGRSDARFNLTRLRNEMPNLSAVDAWWLHPPEWTSQIGFPISLLASLFLGMLIQWLVRPKETRQAIAIALVTGLLMTIVQFSMYGIAADWQTFRLANAEQIDWLAQASMGPESDRQRAIERLNAAFPDLETADRNTRADLLGKAISVKIMLASPASFLGVLSVCLAFSTIYCVGGTVHCNRLLTQEFSRFEVFVRYLEVMMLSTFTMITIVFIVFFTFGMITIKNGATPLPGELIVILAVLIVATIPGWSMMRWYIRWSTYIICSAGAVGLVFAVAKRLE